MTVAAAPEEILHPGSAVTDRAWFDRPALEVAPDLLGMRLIHASEQGTVAGRIVETEAYAGPEDLAAHSARGRTNRTAAMFGAPGHAYVYFVYGIHHCLNVVCGPGSKPEAVLLRAVAIEQGESLARARRSPHAGKAAVPATRLASGPGNLAAAFGVDQTLNGADLIHGPLSIARGPRPERIATRPRIGVAYAGKWAALPWRFLIADDPHVSRR